MAPAGERIGEVWFEPPAELDRLLVKYIFTSEALSVQVHPSDEQVPGSGKEECWLILEAEPGARIAVGFTQQFSPEQIRAAATDGTIETMLEWYPVSAGDFFYIPASTVHAIGAGVSLIEVQQNSDLTYRLYDYGRPRELHLDQGVAVAKGEPYGAHHRMKVAPSGAVMLSKGPVFKLDRLDGPPSAEISARYSGPLLAIPVSGDVRLSGEVVTPGECALADDIGMLEVAPFSQLLIAQ